MHPDSTHSTSAAATHGSNPSGPAANTHRLQREELQRVLAHPEIARSASLVRFLSFICNKYFEGQAEEIREYSIAVEALGRKETNFDSRVDPIVRVTARALRKKLAAYYRAEGRENPLRVVLPLGHYIPQFLDRPEAEEDPEASNSDEQDLDAASGVQDLSPEEDADLPSSGKVARLLSSLQRFWKFGAAAAALIVVFAGGFLLGSRSDKQAAVVSEALQWGQPVWTDEFDGADQQLPDPSRWTFDTGGGGWGVLQVQTYCAPNSSGLRECNPHRPNAFLDGAGHLVLRAEKGPDGTWTSARITTRGLKEFQYGRIEARIKMPVGKGIWPSFWMLGSNFPSVGWPSAGSVTYVENVALDSGSNGLGPGIIRSTVHGPHFYGANGLWHNFRLPSGGRVDDGGFHTYGIIWSPSMIQFYVDDPANVYFVADAKDIPDGGQWVFDHPFYLIMNLGIGGAWPGNPDATTPNPADMLVDYVRVYKIPPVSAPSIEWQPVQVRSGSTVASNVQFHARGYSGRVFLSCSTEPATALCALATPTVNFADTLSQQDTLNITTESYVGSTRILAQPGRYTLTITATSISGDRSQLVVPFDVKE